MEKEQFDELSRTLGKTGPRRLLLQGLGGGAVGLFVTGLLTDNAEARKRRRKRRRQGDGAGGSGTGSGGAGTGGGSDSGAAGPAGTPGTVSIVNNITTIPTVSPGIGEACQAENECSDDCTCQKNVCCPTELTCDAVRTYLGEAGASACGLIEIPGCKPVWCGCAIGSNQYCDEAEDETGTCVACAISSEAARLTYCSPGSGSDQLAAGRCGKQEVPEGCPEVFCTEGCPTDCKCTPKVCPCSS